jgi:UDP-N-acetylglucosamine 2-epimerase (non-hydrolysing)
LIRVLSIFGTRPEALKMAPVVTALAAEPAIHSIVCVTGQHRQMLDQVLSLFDIRPDHDLALMAAGQTLSDLTARTLTALDPVILAEKPDCILVHGDTTTAMAAAVAAFHRRVPIGHVEAGLRTRDLSQPWPEEFNRRVVDVVAGLLFAPTATAKANLEAESVAGRILVTGNTVIDALQETVRRLDADAELRAGLDARFAFLRPGHRLLLVTGHRRENFGAGFEGICTALATLARRSDLDIVYPVHLNPNVKGPVTAALSGFANVHLIEPLDYLPFVHLMRRADVVLTDSGGVQEEAPSLGRPVLVMREVTERPEALAAGTVRLVGTDPGRIVAEVGRLLDDEAWRLRFARAVNPYGDGRAAGRIVAGLLGRPVDEFHPHPKNDGSAAADPEPRPIAAGQEQSR